MKMKKEDESQSNILNIDIVALKKSVQSFCFFVLYFSSKFRDF